MSTATDYWRECIGEAADSCGLVLTSEQLATIADFVESAHENYGLAFYSPPAGEYLEVENKRLQAALVAEREKVVCPECNGRGRIISHGPYHSSDSQCDKCRGEGKVSR